MFNRLDETSPPENSVSVTVSIDGRSVQCRSHDSVAAALLVSGEPACRNSAVSGVPRGPYCMMGVCYECLVMIDGQMNQQGCMTMVCEGMMITRQQSALKERT